MVATKSLGQREVILALPQTFMNDSGTAVLSLMTARGLQPQNLLVVFDEADLPLGTLRCRAEGGSGGHNGVKSIIAAVGATFGRLRIGIGKSAFEGDLQPHVLGRFTGEEETLLAPALSRAVEGIGLFIERGLTAAMETINRKNLS